MKKDKIIEHLKSALTAFFAFVLIVSFFSWYSTVYNYTLISFRILFFISLLISIPFLIWIYKKGFGDLIKDIGLLAVIAGLTIYASSLLFLSINYIPIGEPNQQEFKILDTYKKTVNRKKRQYIKIKWNGEAIELRLFQKIDKSTHGKKKIILETQRGLLGFDIIKNAKLE